MGADERISNVGNLNFPKTFAIAEPLPEEHFVDVCSTVNLLEVRLKSSLTENITITRLFYSPIFIILFLPFVLGPLVPFPSELSGSISYKAAP
jgi:hypothetical protein